MVSLLTCKTTNLFLPIALHCIVTVMGLENVHVHCMYSSYINVPVHTRMYYNVMYMYIYIENEHYSYYFMTTFIEFTL